jgi:hypothetical protein
LPFIVVFCALSAENLNVQEVIKLMINIIKKVNISILTFLVKTTFFSFFSFLILINNNFLIIENNNFLLCCKIEIFYLPVTKSAERMYRLGALPIKRKG